MNDEEVYLKKCAGKCAKAKEQSVVFMYLLDHVEKKMRYFGKLTYYHIKTSLKE